MKGEEKKNIQDHFSIKATRFFMTVVGMWYSEKSQDQIVSNIVLFYTIVTMIIALIVEGFDCYYSWGDLHAIAYNAPCTITVLLEWFKLTKFIINRSEVKNFNAYTDKIFWKREYKTPDLLILDNCNKQSMKIVALYFFLMQLICWQYLCFPIIESYGKNITERTLPFNLWFNFPYWETPYYEIAYFLQSAGTMSTSICATTFATFLFTINLYAAGQFKILQRKLKLTCDNEIIESLKCNFNDNRNFHKLKSCINHHQILIRYIERIEHLYCTIMLMQALGGVLQMCFSGFQIVLGATTSMLRMILSVMFLFGAIIQLLLFSWSCHEIIVESQLVAKAAYETAWYNIPFKKKGKEFRECLLIVILRARKPCILSVGKFAPMSLETFTSVFNSAISYFTILRQMNEENL